MCKFLVAGQRRLQCCIDLGRDLHTGEYRFWEDLTPAEAEAIELEENVKREDLHWRDRVAAYGKLHQYHATRAKAAGEPWSIESSASRLAISKQHLGDLLSVFRNLDSPVISDADSLVQAFSRLQRESERKTVNIVNELASIGAEAFGERPPEVPCPPCSEDLTNHPGLADSNCSIPGTDLQADLEEPPHTTSTISLPEPKPPGPVQVADFNLWAASYSGPKFTFIHCDFPYGIDYTNYGNSIAQTGPNLYTTDTSDYRTLLDSFCTHLDRFASYSAHVIFWFSMTHYEETRRTLASAGLFVHEHPLVWFKTDNAGIIPGQNNQYLRRVYETAFICSRGKRPFVRLIGNAYGAPTTPNAVHPSVKPEPVLRHFFQAVVDSTTDMLDPTCGSASALIAAEDRGARSILGLEVNSSFAQTANDAVEIARTKRRLAGG